MSSFKINRRPADPSSLKSKSGSAVKKKKAVEEKPKKKKKKVSTAITVVKKPKTKVKKAPKDSTLARKKALKLFKLSKNQLNRLLTDNPDRVVENYQKQTLSMIMRLIPIAEKKYKSSSAEHAAYALNALISQGRELASEVQSTQERNDLARRVATELIDPAFRSYLQLLGDLAYNLNRDIKDYVSVKDRPAANREIKKLIREAGMAAIEMSRNLTTRIEDALVG